MLDALLDELHAEHEITEEETYEGPKPLVLAMPTGEGDDGEEHPLVAAMRAGKRGRELDLKGAKLQDENLSNLDLSGADLTGADLARANLTGCDLSEACFRDAMLYGAVLDDTECAAADFSGANLEKSTGKRAGFGAGTFKGTKLAEAHFEDTTFAEATFDDADLRGARFTRARGIRSKWIRCDATSASFESANLREAQVDGSTFDHANMRGATLTGVRGYETASWIGTDTRDIPPLGIYMWKRFVGDQNYLAEFRTRGPVAEGLYWVWWVTSDCGRSISRWMLCTLTLIILFGIGYASFPVDYGANPTWLSPFYFSVVTLTSLGYGDVLPASAAAQGLAMAEVLTGYLMLGGLLSILSNKIARRGD